MVINSLKKINIAIITVILTLGLSVSLQSLIASWTAPSAIAPNDNADAPINVGNNGQSKNGGLVLNSGNMSAYGLVVNNGGTLIKNGLSVENGNVGIGTTAPISKLDVYGEIKVSDTGLVCSTSTAGAIRFNGSDFEGCKNGAWVSFTSSNIVSVASSTKLLYGGVHTEGDCYRLGGSMVVATDGVTNFCKTPGGSCPAGWNKFLDAGVRWTETENVFDPGGSEICISGACATTFPCSTGNHSWRRTDAQEKCQLFVYAGYVTFATAPYSYNSCY